MREMQALVRNYVLNRDRQMKYLAVLIALSLFVSFMVPFILMQPADSMAEASACGIEEHVHTEEAGCYQLFCAPEEGEEHVHSERCYALICEKIVHTHTPNCYPTKPDFSALFSTIYDPENLKATADGQSYANSPKDKPSEYKAPAGSILGVATHFHIFAESVSLQSHVHGNIATNWLLQNGAFGVYNDRLNGMSSINYIRNLGPNGNLDNAYQTQLIMGSDYSSPPSPWFSNRYEIRSKKDRKTYYIPKDKFPMWFAPEYVVPQVKFEKPDRPFINITQELNKFADMSMDLVEEAGAMDNDKGVSTKYPTVKSDQNGNFNGQSTTTPGTVVLQTQGENLTLDFSNIDDKYIYYTIDATNFDMVSPWSSWMKVLQIKGITEDKFLFLNIDVGTNPDAYFSKSWMVYKDDGTTYGTGEVPLEDGGCRVLYNIVSSDGNGGNYKPFEGKAVFGERRNGSILAPNADVNVAGNTNGTIIARNFVATGESHRCDIQQEGTEGDDADWSLGEETPTTPKQQKLEVTVKKNWSGGTSYNGVKVVLYKSKSPTLTDPHKVPGKEATLSSDNGWQTVFKDLPAYEAEEKLYYFVKEETEVSGFTATYENNMISVNSGTITITNVAKKKINVSVEKKWEHPSGSSTTDINVKLYQTTNANLDATKPEQFSGMTAIGDVWLNSGNNWKHTFSDLPELSDDGQKYYYYIVEQNVPANYAAGYTGNGVNTNSGTVTVTNSKDKMVSVTAKKEWKPTAPGSVVTVKVNLYQSTNGSLDATKASDFSSLTPLKTATLTAYNNWSYTFPEYPAMDASGNKYYYYIVEQDAPSGYTTIYTNNGITSDSGEVLITNVKDITVTAKKIWDPDTVASTPTTQETKTYKIMPIGDSITQGELGGVDGSVGGGGAHGGYRKYLDYILEEKYEEFFGKDKTYNIDLVGPKNNVNPFDYNGAADEITATFSFNGTNVTYTYDNNHGGYSAHQSYTDDGNNSVYHQLVNADNNENSGSIKAAQPDIVLLMIGTNDRNALVDPDVYEQRLHTLLDYMLTELPKDSVVFVASIPEFDYYGYKDVTDYNNKVKRVVQSYANSGKNVRFVDVAAFIKLADLSDKIHPSESGYEKMGKNWATVIDSYIQELQPVSSVPAETREPINVRLYKSTNPYLDAEKQTDVDQMTYVQDATLNSDNGWTGKFEGLPAMENGSTLYYYIVEENVPKHYTVTYSNNAVNNNDGTVVVTNTKEKMLNITLDKEWVGGKPNNENITVTLYQSTERNLDMTVSDSDFQQLLNSNKLWKYSDEKNTGKSSVTFTAGETPHFTNLPVYNENGTMYYYYVRESNVSGYKPSYSKNPVYGADKVVTITNTKTISVSVTKNWQDTNGGTQYNGQTVTINLYKYKHIPAEGEMSYWPTTYMPVGSVLVSSQDIYENRTATFGDLPVEENGYKLFYYIEEIVKDENTAKKYDTIYGEDGNGQLADPNQTATYGKTVINKEKDENKISISVKKKWDVSDYWNDDGDGVIEPPNEYYVQDSVNPPEAWADPIKVTLQYSYDGTTWTNYSADCTDVEFYTNHTFTNLPKQINGQNVRYKIVEAYNYGYVTDYGTNNDIEASTITKDTATPVIELKNTLLKRTLNVKKNWYNNINDGVDKVVVEIYRRTSTKKPDLGIGADDTPGGGGNTTPDNPNYINSFDNGTAEGWTEVGNHDNGTNKSGLQTTPTYDGSAYSYGLISQQDGSVNGEAFKDGETSYYYGAYIQKDYTTSELVPGQIYNFSAKVARNSTDQVYAALRVKYNDSNDLITQIARVQTSATSGDWVTISGSFTVPQGTNKTSLQIVPITKNGYMGTMMFVDDVKVERPTIDSSKPVNTFDDGTTQGWTQTGAQSAANSGLQSNVTYNGSAYSYGMVSNNGQASYIQKEFTNLTAGSTYDISAWVTRTYGSAIDVVLRVSYDGGDAKEVKTIQTTANATEWKELAGSITIPAGTQKVTVQIAPITSDGNMGSMLFVDNINVNFVSSGSNEPEPIFYSNTFDGLDGWQPLSAKSGAVAIWSSGNVPYGGSGNALGVGNNNTEGRQLVSDGAYKPLDSSQFVPGNSYKFSAYARSGGGEDTFVLGLRYTLNGQTYRADIASKTIGGGWPDSPIESPAVQIPQGASNVQLCVYTKNNKENFYIDEIKAFAATNGAQLNGYAEPTYNGGSQGGGNTGTDGTIKFTFESTNGGWDNEFMGGSQYGQSNVSLSTDRGYGGSSGSLVFQPWGSANYFASCILSELKAGNTYTYSAWVYSDASSARNIQLAVAYNSAKEGTEVKTQSVASDTWTKIEGTFTVPADATQVAIRVVGVELVNNSKIYIDDVTISGPGLTSATKAKPRNAETFFTNTSTLTKRKLNIQKMETVKLAKATNEYKSINKSFVVTTYEVTDEIQKDSNGNEMYYSDGVTPQYVINFYNQSTVATSSELAFMQGAKLSHMEVHFRTGGDHFTGGKNIPQDTNVWFNGYWQWDHKTNSDKTIHTFKATGDYTISENSSLQMRAMNADDIERIILKCTDGSMLVINNVKTVSAGDNYGSFNVNPNYTKNIALTNDGWTGAWDIDDTSAWLAQNWSGQTIQTIDVYFKNNDTVDQGKLASDITAIQTGINNQNAASSAISTFGFYLMLNRESSGNWGGETVASNVNIIRTENGMKVARYDVNSAQITSGYGTIIFLTKITENVKAIVLNASNGQKYELINTAYTTPTTTTPVEHSVSSEKWYPILNSVTVSDENSNNAATFEILLTPEELYGELGGKKVTKVEVVTRMHTSWVNCQTYLNSNGGTADSGNKLGVTSWSGNVKTYSATRKKIDEVEQDIQVYLEQGDRLFFRAIDTTDQINKVIVYFEGGTPYTIHNMNFDEYDPLKEAHQTGFGSIDSSTNLLQTTGTQYTGYADKYLNYIIVNYGNVTAQPQDKLVVNGTQYSGTPVDGNNSVIRYNVTSGSFDETGLNITTLNLVNDSGDGMDVNYIKDIVMYYDTDTENDTGTGLEWWSTYTITNTDFSDYVPPEGPLHMGHETSFKLYGTSQLLNSPTTYRGFGTKTATHVIVQYGEDTDEFVSIPRDEIMLNETTGSPTIDGDVTMKHTFTNSITNASVLKIIEGASDNATLADIKELTIYYSDGSTYTVGNTDYSPKAEPDVPAIGNQPVLGSDFVFISTLDLTKENGWQAALDGLPVTDGQGNAYEYVIVEKNVYGEGADRYQLVSYEHPDGVILEKDGTQTSFLNTTKDKENGLVIMPSSGGEGKTWFYVAGVALMLCGIAGCYGMKRWQRSRR